MNDAAREKLCGIIETHGLSACDNPRALESLLREETAGLTEETEALIAALKAGVLADLRTLPADAPRDIPLKLLAQQLADETSLSEEGARWAVLSWAKALGVLDPLKPAATPEAPPESPPVPERAAPPPEPSPPPRVSRVPEPPEGPAPTPSTETQARVEQ